MRTAKNSSAYVCTGADYHLSACGGSCGTIDTVTLTESSFSDRIAGNVAAIRAVLRNFSPPDIDSELARIEHLAREACETQTGESPEFERGLASCLRHRCAEHMAVTMLNETATGAECGGCVQSHERDKGVMMARTAVEHKLRAMEKALESKATNTLDGKAAGHHMATSGDIASVRLAALAVLDQLRAEINPPAELSIDALIGKAWRALPDHRCPTCQHGRTSDGTAAAATCDRPAVLCEDHGGHDWCHAKQMERETLWRDLCHSYAEGRTGKAASKKRDELRSALGICPPKAQP